MVKMFAILSILCVFLTMGSVRCDEWEEVRAAIDAAEHEKVIVLVGQADNGTVFSYAKGGQNEDDFMGVASASKIVTGSIFMRLYEQRLFSLDDYVHQYLDYWSDDHENEIISNVTIAQLLAFTSGFSGEAPCLLTPNVQLQDCARSIYEAERFLRFAPGSTYFYSSNHLQVIGAIAEVVSGLPWSDLFDVEFRRPLGLSNNTFYVGETNPLLAASLRTSPAEYEKYFHSYFIGDYLDVSTTRLMETDFTPSDSVAMAFTPNNWGKHYGLANWFECLGAGHDDEDAIWREECLEEDTHGSKGANGFFPIVDRKYGYYMIIGTYTLDEGSMKSARLADTLRPLVVEALSSL